MASCSHHRRRRRSPPPSMAAFSPSLFLLLFLLLAPLPSLAGPVASEFVYPNFTASYLQFVDTRGTFLSSSAFSAAFYNPGEQSSRSYLVVLHSPSGAVVWTANPAAPVSSSGSLAFTSAGLVLTDGSPVWSTPRLSAPAAALQLLPSGELRLLDAANASLWSAFDFPTDTLLPNQLLPVSTPLSSPSTAGDSAPGDYRLVVTPSDAVLRWAPTSQVYWSVSSDLRSTKDSNLPVSYLTVNATGLYLLAGDGKTAVFRMTFQSPTSSGEFLKARLDSSGRFRIQSFSQNESLSAHVFDTDFLAPGSDCDLPYTCGSLGLCTPGANSSKCGCDPSFGALSPAGCSPADGNVLANSSCGDSSTGGGSPSPSYMALGSGTGYFGTKYSLPTTSGGSMSACRDLCSWNCSCLGFFYRKTSKSCFLLQHRIGSLFSVDTAGGDTPPAGYIKVFNEPPSAGKSSSARFVIVLLPSTATILLVISVSVIWFKMRRRNKRKRGDMTRTKSASSGLWWPMAAEISDVESEKEEEIVIPGLPTRYTYAQLEATTNNFDTRIGSGGFGSVYKGQLPDKSLVAVKRIDAISNHGRREFCTEIAVIGNIHHVNLVRLRGFCAQGSRRLLVYEYMNRGSLDRALFGRGPALEWQERVDIAVGAARGLAYLHAGCDHRIIHCDVKPENILLHDHNQVKIADFGLAKLLSPEQSALFTTMRGTRGYLAPEWLTNAAISDKTDVYSFGMVLLEIVRGRKNRVAESEVVYSEPPTCSSDASPRPVPVPYFPMMALEMHEMGSYEDLADPRLEGRVIAPEVEGVVKVALCCLHEEPAARPSMMAVAAMLQGTMPAAQPRLELLDYLRLYGRGSRDTKARRASATSSGFSISPLLSYLSSQDVSGPR